MKGVEGRKEAEGSVRVVDWGEDEDGTVVGDRRGEETRQQVGGSRVVSMRLYRGR